MARRLWVSLGTLALWSPMAATLSVLEGCSHRSEIRAKDPVEEQRTGDRYERRRELRAPRLERRVYDG